MREEQQRGTTTWVQGELDRTSEWIVQLRQEQQAQAQQDASQWLEHELERAPRVVMGSARDTYLGGLSGEEGVVTAALAWIPVALVAGETIKVGLDVVKVVCDLVGGQQRRRTA